jgi:hypothetical protein
MPKRVFSSTGCCVFNDRTPYPFEWITFPSLIIATAIPGTSKALRDRSTRLSISPEVNDWQRPPRQIDKGNSKARKIFMAVSFGSKYKENQLSRGLPYAYRIKTLKKH